MDYGKFKFEQEKRPRKPRKNLTEESRR